MNEGVQERQINQEMVVDGGVQCGDLLKVG
jgi:hypothetical protein